MTTYRQIVNEISAYLVDQEPEYEFTHWSEDEVRTYLQDALRILAMNAKRLFVSRKIITLQPGAHQTLDPGCAELHSVLGAVNRRGEVVAPMRRASYRAATSIARPTCAGAGGYRPTTYSVDSGDARSFVISPPAPAGGREKVAVMCFAPPVIHHLDEEYPAPDDTIPIVKELMMYYAYGQDTESVPARDYQKTHWTNGVSLLGAYVGRPALQTTVAQTPSEVPV